MDYGLVQFSTINTSRFALLLLLLLTSLKSNVFTLLNPSAIVARCGCYLLSALFSMFNHHPKIYHWTVHVTCLQEPPLLLSQSSCSSINSCFRGLELRRHTPYYHLPFCKLSSFSLAFIHLLHIYGNMIFGLVAACSNTLRETKNKSMSTNLSSH